MGKVGKNGNIQKKERWERQEIMVICRKGKGWKVGKNGNMQKRERREGRKGGKKRTKGNMRLSCIIGSQREMHRTTGL